MPFTDMQPDDILNPGYVEAYKQNVGIICDQLSLLNSNMFVLEKLLNFPFDLFLSNYGYFWELVENSLFESSILTIWRISVDKGFAEGFTLQRLKNEIRLNITDEAIKKLFDSEIKNTNFTKILDGYEPKVTELRHNYIAHFNLKKNTFPTPEDVKNRTLIFKEAQHIQETLNQYFNVLALGKYSVVPLEYYPEVITHKGPAKQSDIEQLLEDIALNSETLLSPENDTHYWAEYRKSLPQGTIDMFNKYRQLKGLPGA